ncbi:serine hydrolase domain-containing protein [Paenibacillus aceris]|uniref:CubicO group peptidase (Beta-lactamase class C family) n=1 Tax=Paenibacillus aceris TaxID=869555 RepID=A0ABS4I6V3_9BACL|nr:serine hydrolase [Paenibacillus aceris]MBP1966642.1 CubicO group peptidase (beta-lactamase class C family) [Paenibacillus aceris]NHW38878.1 serine hydrolase [Paenibacillus aceris]
MSLNVKNELVLPRSKPEAQGLSSSAIVEFLEAVRTKNLELHSFMLLRNGFVISEGWWSPYEAELPHLLFSLSKSFTSTAIGLAVSEGILSLDDQVLSFFPDETPSEVAPNLFAMQIRHLLMMGTGHSQDTMDSLWKQANGNWVEAFLQQPVNYEPGTHFVYNSGATYMLSAILNKVTGQSLLDYLQPRLLNPLGITGATWEMCPRGIQVGGWGLSVTTESIAKFGQLYLQQGIWNGARIISADWVAEATSKQISNGDGGESDWAQGYGYQFWNCRHEAYRGDGAFGQFCIVMPQQNAVMAITAGLNDMQAVLNTVWTHLLPAMTPSALPHYEESAVLLAEKLQELRLGAPQVADSSPREAEFTGSYQLEENTLCWETLTIAFDESEANIKLRNNKGDHHLRCGRGAWVEQASRLNQGMEQRIAASFTWSDPDTLELTVRYIETPFCHTAVCRLNGTQITLELKSNLSFGPRDLSPIRGRLQLAQ